MSDLLRRFKGYLGAELGLAPGSVEGYLRDAGEFLAWTAGRPFTGELVDRFLGSARIAGLAASTRNRKRMSCRGLYNYLVQINRLDAGQLSLIDPIRQDRRTLPALAPSQVERLIAACDGESAERDKAILRTLAASGIRVSELCALDLRDVHAGDVTRGVQISNLKSQISDQGPPAGRPYLKVMGKGRVERMVPISGDCLEAIRHYAGAWRIRYALDVPALFIRRDGRRVHRLAVTGMIDRLCCRAGVPHSTSHTLRRTCATAMLDAGATVQAVQRQLGHLSIDSTQQYLAASQGRLRDVYRRCHPGGGGVTMMTKGKPPRGTPTDTAGQGLVGFRPRGRADRRRGKDPRAAAPTERASEIMSDWETEQFLMATRRVQLFGDIDEDAVREAVQRLWRLAAEGNDAIHLYISSDGGFVDEGIGLIDQMMVQAAPVTTIVTGRAYSMAAVIAACGAPGRRFIMPNASIMLHPISFASEDYVGQVLEHTGFMGRYYDRMLALLAGRMRTTGRRLARRIERGLWLTPAEAIKARVVDGLWTPEMEAKVNGRVATAGRGGQGRLAQVSKVLRILCEGIDSDEDVLVERKA